MPLRDDRGSIDREILDIIPERFDPDPDSHQARRSAQTRLVLTVALALLAVAALGVAARHILFGESPKENQAQVPVIHADDKPLKTRPQDRGGMEVPNQDKLVYERMGAGESEPQSERLLPPPEQPQAPPAQQPRAPSIKPAFPAPPMKDTPAAAKPEADSAAPPPAAAMTAPAPTAAAPTAPAKPATRSTVAPSPADSKPAVPETKMAAVTPPPPAAERAAPAAAQTKPGVAKPVAGGAWLVQLGALKSEGEAKTEWTRLRGVDKDLLGDFASDIVRVDLGAKGIYWRLRAGPMDEAKARTLCAALGKRGQGCLVAKK
jgi:hypothetical protein